MALLATDGSILNANRSLCQMLGYSKHDLRALCLGSITHPDDVGTELEQRHRLAAADISRYELVQRCVRKDRTVMWVRLSVAAARKTSGELENFVAQVESVPSHYLPKPEGDGDGDIAGFKDAAHAAMHEIANSLTPLMLNTEMLVEQSTGNSVRESAHEIFKAARRIAFALRRVWGIEDVQPVAYLGENRMLDLRLVAPPADTGPDTAVEPILKVI